MNFGNGIEFSLRMDSGKAMC